MSAPPGHDPEVSLLAGGTTPINPVMGGGAMEGGTAIAINPIGVLNGSLTATQKAAAITAATAAAASGQPESVIASVAAQAATAAGANPTIEHVSQSSSVSVLPNTNPEDPTVLFHTSPSTAQIRKKEVLEARQAAEAAKNLSESDAANLLLNTTPQAQESAAAVAQVATKDALQSGATSQAAANQGAAAAIGQLSILEKPREKSTDSEAASEILPSDNIYIEYYAIQDGSDSPYTDLYHKAKAKLYALPSLPSHLHKEIDRYQAYHLQNWQNTSGYATVNAFKNMKPNEVIQTFSHLTYVLPKMIDNIIVIPPIRGSIQGFIGFLETLEQIGILNSNLIIRENTVVIFSSPFYGDIVKLGKENPILLKMIMDIQLIAKNKHRCFVLSESTSENYAVGHVFHTMRKMNLNIDSPIINMLEPSYIIYPYYNSENQGIVISSSTISEIANLPAPSTQNTQGLKEFLNTTGHENGGFFSYKPDIKTEAAGNYFSVRSWDPNAQFQIPVFNESRFKCNNENLLLASYNINKHPSELNKRINLGASSTNEDFLIAFRIHYDNPYQTLCKIVDLAAIDIPLDNGKFVGAAEAAIGNIDVEPVELAGETYNIRIIDRANTIVMNDWIQGYYTNDEAAFLNALNLRPRIMPHIFPAEYDAYGSEIGMPWEKWVGEFLKNVTISQCFTTLNFMSKADCNISRLFTEKVANYFSHAGLKSDLFQSLEAQAEEERLHKKEKLLEEKERIKQVTATLQPDATEATGISKNEFSNFKKNWEVLEIGKNILSNEWFTYILQITGTGSQNYLKVDVSSEKFPSEILAREALIKKIEELKSKYTESTFIY